MEIKTFVNNPLPSNCFLIIKDEHVIVVDPGSKDCSELITYIKSKKFIVDYIILTHDHFDHVWGADKLRGEFDAPIVCSGICKNKLSTPRIISIYYTMKIIRILRLITLNSLYQIIVRLNG